MTDPTELNEAFDRARQAERGDRDDEIDDELNQSQRLDDAFRSAAARSERSPGTE